MSDLIWGTDAAHTSAGRRPNPSPWKSYWASGLGVGGRSGGGSGGTPQLFRWAQFGLVALSAEEPHICCVIKSEISGENCLVLLKSSHADVVVGRVVSSPAWTTF